MAAIKEFFPYNLDLADYLINCSYKHKYVYMEIPKAASTTIKKMLQLIEVNGDHSRIPTWSWERNRSPLPLFSKMNVPWRRVFFGDEFFRFSFVRNPYTRILSCYLDKFIADRWDERRSMLVSLGLPENSLPTFVDFLYGVEKYPHANIHWAPQEYLLNKRKIDYHYLGRFEQLSVGLEIILQRIAPEMRSILLSIKDDTHSTNASQQVSKYIESQERLLIRRIYKRDFDSFGYSDNLCGLE